MLPIPFPADLPDPGIEPGSPVFQANSLPIELSGKPYTGIIYAYEKADIKVFTSVKSREGFTDLAYPLLPIFPWF